MTPRGKGMDGAVRKLFRRFCYFLYLLTMGGEFLAFVRLRRALMNTMLGRRHEGLFIGPRVTIQLYSRLKLGDHVSINHGCTLSCEGELEIGDHVAIGHGTSIMTTEHGYGDPAVPIKHQPVSFAKVTIGSNVWIGAQAIILAGVSIAEGTIVGAGSTVTKSVTERDTIVAGSPARKIKDRLADRSGNGGDAGAGTIPPA